MARKSLFSKTDVDIEPDPGAAAAAGEPGTNPVSAEVVALHVTDAALPEGAGAPEESAIASALSEAEQANRLAEEALAAEGVKVKPADRPERRPRTREQLVREARRQREYGRKLLARRTGGLASVVRSVKINNAVLAAAFERFFPVIDQCGYLVGRSGAATLGEAAAEQILDRLGAMARDVLEDRRKTLSAVQAVIGETSLSMGDSFTTPQFVEPAFDGAIQIRSPHGKLALEIFLVSDAILTEAETMYWNGLRTLSERNDEAFQAKRAVQPIFTFAGSTTRHLYRRMRDRAGEIESRGLPAPGQSEPERQTAPVGEGEPAPAD